MTNNLLNFPDVTPRKPKKEEIEPHRSGTVRCLNCKHEWVACAPIGVVDLECLNCHTFQGLFKGISSTDYSQWRCDCGEFTFFIDEHSPYCAHCGIRPTLSWSK